MADIEALYVVRFAERLIGAGVVVLETQRLFGGDSQFYWVGDYRVENRQINARAKVVKHTDVPGFATIFGDAAGEFNVRLTGTVDPEGNIVCAMTRDDMPGQIAPVLLERRDSLP